MHRILFAGDLHKRPKDIATIRGYVDCTIAVQQKLRAVIKELKCDYFVSLGDWYDKGYATDLAASHADQDADMEMAKQLEGKFYGLIGNHIRLHMDSNPGLLLIQPHETLRSRRSVTRAEQIIRTPKELRIGDVQISFMHHNPKAVNVKEYKPVREPWARYHIALFHTPMIIPNSRLLDTGFGYNASSNTDIAVTLEGVDLAICGDVHKPIGQFNVGNTVVIVPGSLTNTDAGEINRHTSISAPVVTIEEDGSVRFEYYNLNLQTNLVTFNKKNVEYANEKLKTLRGNTRQDLHMSDSVVASIPEDECYASLNRFMQSQSYTEKDKKLVRQVLSDPEGITELLTIFKEEVYL